MRWEYRWVRPIWPEWLTEFFLIPMHYLVDNLLLTLQQLDLYPLMSPIDCLPAYLEVVCVLFHKEEVRVLLLTLLLRPMKLIQEMRPTVYYIFPQRRHIERDILLGAVVLD